MSHRIVAQTGWTAMMPALAGASRPAEPAKFAAMLAEGVPAGTHDRVAAQMLKLRSTPTVVDDSAVMDAEEVDGALSAGAAAGTAVKTGFVTGQGKVPVEQMPLPTASVPVEARGGRSVVRQAPQKTVVAALQVERSSVPGSVETVKDKVAATPSSTALTQREPAAVSPLAQNPAMLSEATVPQQIPSLPTPVGPDAGESESQDAPVAVLSTGGRRLPVQGVPVSAVPVSTAPVETSPMPGAGEVPIHVRTPSLPPSTGPVTEESGRRSAPPSSILSRGGESVRRQSDPRSYPEAGAISSGDTGAGQTMLRTAPVAVASTTVQTVLPEDRGVRNAPPLSILSRGGESLHRQVGPRSYSDSGSAFTGDTVVGSGPATPSPALKVAASTGAQVTAGKVDQGQGAPVLVSELMPQPAVAPLPGAKPQGSASREIAPDLSMSTPTVEGSGPVAEPVTAGSSASASELFSQRPTGEGSAVQVPRSTREKTSVKLSGATAAMHPVAMHPAVAPLAGAHKIDAQPAAADSSARPSGAVVLSADVSGVASSKVVPTHLLSPETLVQPAHVPVPGEAPESAKTTAPNGSATMPETVSTTSARADSVSEPRTLAASAQALEVGVASGTHGWLRVRAEMGHAGEVTASVIANSSRAAESLHRELPGLGEYLAREQVGVSAVAVATAGFTPSATAGSNAAATGAAGEQARQQAASNGEFTGQNGSARTGDRQGAAGSSASLDLSSSVAEMASLPGGARGSGGWVNVRV